MSTEPENCVGGRVGGARLYPRPYILVATGRKMRCLIVQSIGWEIGRRRGKAILANMTQSSLHLENGTGDCLRDGLWSKKCVCVCVCARACVCACMLVCVRACSCVHTLICSVISDSVTSWTTAHQAPLSKEFFRQEYWNGLPFPMPGDLPDPGMEPVSLTSPVLVGGFFTTKVGDRIQPQQFPGWVRAEE